MKNYIIREIMEPEAPEWNLEGIEDLYIMQKEYYRSYSLVNNDSFQDLLKEIDDVMYELEEYEARDVMPDYDIP